MLSLLTLEKLWRSSKKNLYVSSGGTGMTPKRRPLQVSSDSLEMNSFWLTAALLVKALLADVAKQTVIS